MSAEPTNVPVAMYIVEVSKDDPRRTIDGFSPYSPSPVSPVEVRKALDEQDRDLASIQLAHYWLQTDRWIRNHNAEAERERKEAEDMRKLAEKKKAEIEEDRRRRAEWEEKEKRRREKGKGREVEPEAGPSSPRKRKATEEPGASAAKRPKVSVLGFPNKANIAFLQFDPEEHRSKPLRTPACRSCVQRGWPCVDQSREKQKAVTCLACNLKKIPCRVGSPDSVPKRKVRKPVAPIVQQVSSEEVVRNSARQVRGPHDLYSSKAPGYSQQVLDELVTTSENTSELRRILDASRKDQWKLGKRQLKLEELRLKVELGVLSSEQAAEELGNLPDLAWPRVEHPVYQSVYQRWEEVQEKLAAERENEASSSEEEAEAVEETMRE